MTNMNPLIEFLKQTLGTTFINPDGASDEFKLLPPLSEQELASLCSNIPCPLPPDILELLTFARGFDGTRLEEVRFADPDSASEVLGEIFPHAISLANDGAGNFWIVDLTKDSKSWGPIFFACHDAPVIVYQADNLLQFVQEVVRGGNRPWKSEVDDVSERFTNLIWSDNPGVLSHAHCLLSADQDLKAFAESIDETWQFVDLRNPVRGDGFSWGRYGPTTAVKRFGEKRIFAYQKKGLGRRFLEAIR
jgi:hypothetical protein